MPLETNRGHRRSQVLHSKAGLGFLSSCKNQRKSPSVRGLDWTLEKEKITPEQTNLQKEIKKGLSTTYAKRKKGQYRRMSVLGLVLLSSYLRAQKTDKEKTYEPILPTNGLLTSLPGHNTSQSAVPEVMKSAIIIVLVVTKAKKNFLQNCL